MSETNCDIVARKSFIAPSNKFLSFVEQESLKIIEDSKDPNWVMAVNSKGVVGLVPLSHVRKRGEVVTNIESCYHGKIDRAEVESIFVSENKPGSYLLRDSVSQSAMYVLSILSENDKIVHFYIYKVDSQYSINKKQKFDTIGELLKNYEKDSSLGQLLKYPITPENRETVVDRVAFESQGWFIKPSDLVIIKKIGSGEFGDVYSGYYQETKVAIKQLKDNSGISAFLKEALVMTSINNPNVVCLFGVSIGRQVSIVTEFLDKGSLLNFLRSRGPSEISEAQQAKFSLDIASGMAYLEKRSIIHRDLAARNILLSKENCAKVADLGLAVLTCNSMDHVKIPIRWAAPESISDRTYTTKSDVWSYGVVLWEIYSFGQTPYKKFNIEEITEAVNSGRVLEKTPKCPLSLYALMKRCWSANPSNRPNFETLVNEFSRICGHK